MGIKLLNTNENEIRKIFGKTEKDAKEDVGILKTWAKSQPHFPEVPGDCMIELFLTNNKYSIEKTKQNLDMYYTLRGLLPEFYNNPKLPAMQETYKNIYEVYALPRLTKDHYRVMFLKLSGDAEVFDAAHFVSHFMNVMEVRLNEDLSLGIVVVFDTINLSAGHIVKITPILVKRAVTILEKVFSNRIKAIYYINSPTYIDVLVTLVKGILKPKLAKRMNVFKRGDDSFLEQLSKNIMPRDYGGDEVSLEELSELWRNKLDEYQDRFDKLDKMKVNEELRPAPLENSDILGYHGNFKKLDVD